MIAELNRLVELVENHLTDEIDVAGLAIGLCTTEYHLRRMFSSLAGMPLSEYIRRRRMSVAAAEVLRETDLLGIAVRFGYGSTEAFGRAFRSVHGVSPGDARRDGGPLRIQPQSRSVPACIASTAASWMMPATSPTRPLLASNSNSASSRMSPGD